MYAILGPEFKVTERANDLLVPANHNAAPHEKNALTTYSDKLLRWILQDTGFDKCAQPLGTALGDASW